MVFAVSAGVAMAVFAVVVIHVPRTSRLVTLRLVALRLVALRWRASAGGAVGREAWGGAVGAAGAVGALLVQPVSSAAAKMPHKRYRKWTMRGGKLDVLGIVQCGIFEFENRVIM